MTPFGLIARRLELARKRRRLQRIERFIGDLEDQVKSGETCLKKYRALAAKLELQISAIEPADEILRRAGAL